jgi:endo-1,4-beta-xylanase
MMNRRTFLMDALMTAGFAAMPAGMAAITPAAEKGAPTSLKDVGAPCGLKIGVQAEKAPLQQSPAFAEAVKNNFNLLTPGNELKWPRLRPTPDAFNFTDADWMVNFGLSNGMLIHGHNLCWNSPSANPPWFKSVLNKSNASHYLTEHITTVMRRYAGRIDSWDVVNEPTVFWSKRSDGLYPGIWVDLLGPTYIDTAFHAAAAADPKALRVLNVYHVEHGTPDDETTRRETIALLKQLIARGVPIQAVGIESHLDASMPLGGAALTAFIKQIRDMGLQMLITELDVNDTHVPGNIQARDAVVAKTYQDYLSQVVPASGTKRIIFWTPSDKFDWLDSAHQDRPDKTPHRAGLIDSTMAPKSAFAAVQSALQGVCPAKGAVKRPTGVPHAGS